MRGWFELACVVLGRCEWTEREGFEDGEWASKRGSYVRFSLCIRPIARIVDINICVVHNVYMKLQVEQM